jgi:hypothetical protein
MPARVLREREAEGIVRPHVTKGRLLVVGPLAGNLYELAPDFDWDLGGTAASGTVIERIERPIRDEAVAPLPRHVIGDPEAARDLAVADALGGEQQNLGSQDRSIR